MDLKGVSGLEGPFGQGHSLIGGTNQFEIAFIGHALMAFVAAAYAVLERIVADGERGGYAVGVPDDRLSGQRSLRANKLADLEAVNRRLVAGAADDAFRKR